MWASMGLGLLGQTGGPTSISVMITGGEILEPIEGEIQETQLDAEIASTQLEGSITEPLEGEIS